MKVDKQKKQSIAWPKDTQKALLWNIDNKFPHVLSILDNFSIFNVDNNPINITSSKFRMYGHSEINYLSNHFFAYEEENKDTLLKNGKVLSLIYCQWEENGQFKIKLVKK